MADPVFADSGHFTQQDMPESMYDRQQIIANRQAVSGSDYVAQQSAGELGFFATTYEMYMQETLVGDMLRYGIVPADKRYFNFEYKPGGFNPYRYFVDNRDSLQDMEDHIKSYLFDDVYDEKQFNLRVERLREAQMYRDQLANGNFAGMLVGGLAGFADITTLVPGLGLAKKTNTLGRIGSWALAGGYYSAVQEAALHTRQELRTLDESIYNTIGGTVIGGGFGVFGRALDPQSPLYYKGKNNPLHPNNPVSLGIGRIGTGMKENAVLKPIFQNGETTWKVVAESDVGQSVGAAARKTTELAKSGALTAQGAARVPIKAIGKAGEYATLKLGAKVSPVVRGLTSYSKKMREYTESMFNIGGIMTEGHRNGIAKPSVEDRKLVHMQRFENEVLAQAHSEYTQLRVDLAGGKKFSETAATAADAGQRAKQLGKDILAGRDAKPRQRALTSDRVLNEWEFHDLTFKQLFDDITIEEMDNLIARFGEDGADLIVNAVKRQAERIHTLNEINAQVMREKGYDFEDLGREYGVAQMWDARGIRNDPDGAFNFFMQIFGTRPTDEFIGEYGLSPEQFAKLGEEEVSVTVNGKTTKFTVEEGQIQKREMLEEWMAGEKTLEEAQLEAKIAEAEDAVVRTRREAVLAARSQRTNWTDIKNASLDELKKLLDKKFALRKRRKTAVDKLVAERKKAKEELKAAEEEVKIRLNQFHDVTKATAKNKSKRGAEVKEAEALLKMVEDEGNMASKADNDFAREQVIKADNELRLSGDDALDAAVKEAAKKPVSSRRLATLQERIRNLNSQIKKKQSELEAFDLQLEAFSKSLTEATARKKQLIDLKKFKTKMAQDTQKTARKAKRDLKKLKRDAKKAETKAPLHLYVDDLVQKLGNRKKDPFGGFDSELIITESGRTKRRHIRMTNEERRVAIEKGYLQADLYSILMRSTDDLSTRFALHDVFGNKGIDAMIKDIQTDIREDFRQLKNKAQGKPRRLRQLEKQEKTALKDVENGFARMLGVLGVPDSAESMLAWASQLARQINYVRYGSGFLIPSTADLANVTFTSGFGVFTAKNFKAWNRTMSGMSNREIRLLAIGSERILHNSTVMKMNQAEAAREMTGVGDYGTWTHYTTSTADRVIGGLSEATNIGSGMSWWNTRMKALAMVQMQDTFVRHMLRWDSILSAASANNIQSQKIIAEMASLGLGADEIRAVRKMMAKHEPELVEGVYELNMGRWLDEGKEGQTAYEAVNIALNNVATRAIMTPGKGDTPFLMSNNYAKMVLQFQTYGFVSLNKYMLPAFQRMAGYGDMQAFMSMVLAAGLGYGIVAATDLKRSGEIKQRSLGQWGYDIVDRAGFLMFLSTPISAASQQLGMTGASRYSMEKNRLALLAGPSGGLINDIWDLTDATIAGDGDRMSQVGTKLMPFKLYKQIADVILDN